MILQRLSNKSGTYWTNQYVVVRKDIPVVHQGVQAAHAAVECQRLYRAEVCFPYPLPLIILEVPNKFYLELAYNWARLQNSRVKAFVEPDVLIEGEKPFGFTAFSYFANMFEPSSGYDRSAPQYGNPLSFLKLWTPV